jgi:hypothetical protein
MNDKHRCSRVLRWWGAVLLCLERAATAAYPVTVERHQGRYFIAGGHRFHVYDDWRHGTARHTWRKPAAMVWLASPEELAAAAAMQSPRTWQPPAPPAGTPEPNEAW